jgi:GrpB-like predicted nucleotidyltransferase (UPF0157 family)
MPEEIGLPRTVVKLSPYNEQWIKIYEAEQKILKESLGELILDIQHVGSTSIYGLISKPVIDIAVGVRTIGDCEKCIKPLVNLGFSYRHNSGPKGGYHFAKGNELNRTHYVHVEEFNGKLWLNHILFRDYLRTHRDVMKKYADLKKELAEKFPNDRISYLEGKSEFIGTIIENAKKELGITDSE